MLTVLRVAADATCLQQNMKDSIVVTGIGAEALPFLEAWGVLPASVGFFMLYAWLVRDLRDPVTVHISIQLATHTLPYSRRHTSCQFQLTIMS